MIERLCDNCRKYKPLSHFEIKQFRDGVRYFCKDNIEKNKNTNGRKPRVGRKYLVPVKEKVNLKKKDKFLQTKFGITLNKYLSILLLQDNCCKICGLNMDNYSKYFDVDHNHENNQVRGLLCNRCNMGIGLLRDDFNLVKNAIDYLEKYK